MKNNGAEPNSARVLNENEFPANPIQQFSAWFREALAGDIIEPTAMTLATATRNGYPSARMVLLKHFDEAGFVFFTNYESRKGRDLAENPRAALLFYWAEPGRQVRIEGPVERISATESDAYFRTRPRGGQIAACISHQSRVVESREELLKRYQQFASENRQSEIPRPGFWGGYRMQPEMIEFWQHGPNRLHDRLRYRKDENGHWILERLAP